MPRHFNLLAAGAALITLPALLTGCIDDDYDLSDLDKTVQLQVNDLTIPVNLDEIYLKNILKPDESSIIKEIDGEYAVVQTGSITSDPVEIAVQRVAAPTVNPTIRTIYEGEEIPDGVEFEPTEEVHAYSIVDIMGDFTYDKSDIPSEILDLRYLGVDWTIAITVSVNDPDGAFRHLSFTDVVISLPKGLSTPDNRYNPTTGDLDLGTVTVPAGQLAYTLSVPVKGVDLTKWSAEDFKFTPAANADAKGSVHFAGHVGVKSGNAVVTILATSAHRATVDLTMAPTLSAITIDSFSGRIRYTFDNLNIPAVNINDLPDLLNDPSTDIRLSNPQLYLSVNNPVANYKLDASTGLTLTPTRDGVDRTPCTLDAGQTINIGHDKGVDGPYTFCISPSKPDSYYKGYEGATHVGCADFSNILAGEGFPTAIKVDLTDAGVVPGDVDNFRLGVSMGSIKGDYTVYCPLALDAGSTVVYSDTIDGWNDETVDRIVISSLTLNTTVTNNLPFEVVLTGYPLSMTDSGQAVRSVDPDTHRDVTITEVTIPAMTAQAVTLSTDGTVTRLDGIHFTARASVTDSDRLLTPDTAVKLSDIRVTVSGSYTDTL